MSEGSVHDRARVTAPEGGFSRRDLLFVLERDDPFIFGTRKRMLRIREDSNLYTGQTSRADGRDHWTFIERSVGVNGPQGGTYYAMSLVHLPESPWTDVAGDVKEGRESAVYDPNEIKHSWVSVYRKGRNGFDRQDPSTPMSTDIDLSIGVDDGLPLDAYDRVVYTAEGPDSYHYYGDVVDVQFGEFVVEPVGYAKLTESRHTVSPDQVIAGRYDE